MIGCIVFAGFLGFFAVGLLRHRRCAAPHGWAGPPWGRRGRGAGHWMGPWINEPGEPGAAGGPDSGHRRGRGTWMWAALSRLDLSPAQEKVVREEVQKVKDKARSFRDEGSKMRGDMARSVRGEEFEEGALADMFIRQDDRMHALRDELAGALGRVHTVLEPDQRERLAELLEKGPGRGGPWAGPYR